MLRGTTPFVTLTLPEDTVLDTVAVMYMSIGQGGKDLFDVDIDHLTIDTDANTVTAALSQAQTLQLDATQKTQIQLRWKNTDGNAYGTYIVKVSTEAILKEGVI